MHYNQSLDPVMKMDKCTPFHPEKVGCQIFIVFNPTFFWCFRIKVRSTILIYQKLAVKPHFYFHFANFFVE
ncbi:hypothetical protein BHE18_13480 [Rossellomorea aquimaris]|uniref:Uncharacterized protein n=1 Tax=Rossellomorea aquimaris TaxID=189382 RepID=A0A1J6VNL5_9BACI|nr:hypothetical protein BHE18_13480 [Rossellomorea aquimaris]